MQAIPALDMTPPAQDPAIDYVGEYTVYQGSLFIYALHDITGELPRDWDVYRAGCRHKGDILACHCLLKKGDLFYIDAANEARCSKHFEETLALEAEDEDDDEDAPRLP